MISFTDLRLNDAVPIYKQILLFVEREVIAGNIKDGDELPSRRTISALLGVNPNTVQKAYKILEDENLIVSRSGAKSCMALDSEKIVAIRNRLLDEEVQSAVSSLKQMGLSLQDSLKLIEHNWERIDCYEA